MVLGAQSLVGIPFLASATTSGFRSQLQQVLHKALGDERCPGPSTQQKQLSLNPKPKTHSLRRENRSICCRALEKVGGICWGVLRGFPQPILAIPENPWSPKPSNREAFRITLELRVFVCLCQWLLWMADGRKKVS